MPTKPAYKKRYPKKTYRRYKKVTKRPFANMDPRNDAALTIMNKQRRQVMSFTRSLSLDFVQQTGSGYYNDYKFVNCSLSDLPNMTEFQNLFSKYRFKRFDLTIRAPDLSTQGYIQPTVYVWRNKNTAMSLATITTVQQLPNVYNKQFSDEHRQIALSMKPYMLISAFSGGFEQAYDKWIDIAYSTVPYYGFGIFIENLTKLDIAGQLITVDLTVHLECLAEK